MVNSLYCWVIILPALKNDRVDAHLLYLAKPFRLLQGISSVSHSDTESVKDADPPRCKLPLSIKPSVLIACYVFSVISASVELQPREGSP
jgi:hypothetical protein